MLSHIWNALIVVLVLGVVFYAGMCYQSYRYVHVPIFNTMVHR